MVFNGTCRHLWTHLLTGSMWKMNDEGRRRRHGKWVKMFWFYLNALMQLACDVSPRAETFSSASLPELPEEPHLPGRTLITCRTTKLGRKHHFSYRSQIAEPVTVFVCASGPVWGTKSVLGSYPPFHFQNAVPVIDPRLSVSRCQERFISFLSFRQALYRFQMGQAQQGSSLFFRNVML